jgi:hypothetical protein
LQVTRFYQYSFDSIDVSIMSTQDPDVLSRLGVKLESGGGSWDEIVAFTERILNNNFLTIFNQNKTMQRIQYDDPDGGIVDVKLSAPRIIIPGQEDMLLAKTVYFQIRYALICYTVARADITKL